MVLDLLAASVIYGAQQGVLDSAWLQIILAVVASGSLGILITQLFRKENTEQDTNKIANEAAGIALKSLREELKEALLLSEQRRLIIDKQDRKINRHAINAQRHRLWDLEIVHELKQHTGADYPPPPKLLEDEETDDATR